MIEFVFHTLLFERLVSQYRMICSGSFRSLNKGPIIYGNSRTPSVNTGGFIINLENLKLKIEYDSESDHIAEEFYGPCLANCTKYWRSSGFFSSSLFDVVGSYLKDFLDNGGIMRLITNIEFNKIDFEAINKATNSEKIVEGKIQQIIEEEFTPPLNKGSMIMTKLLQLGRLEIKIVAKPEGQRGIFHEKTSIFFNEDYKIATQGSMNDGEYALDLNAESFAVYRMEFGGVAEKRINKIYNRFNEYWAGGHGRYSTFSWPDALTKNLIKIREQTESGSYLGSIISKKKFTGDPRFDEHQNKAINLFLEPLGPTKSEQPMPADGKGILCMATGTGKTWTAIKLIDRMLDENKIDQVIITTRITDVCEQWAEELEEIGTYAIYRQYGKEYGDRELMNFYWDDEPKSFLITAVHGFVRYLTEVIDDDTDLSRTLLIVDECHNFRGEGHREKMDGKYDLFRYKLGLSATPDSKYSEEANEFLYKSLANTGITKPYFIFGLEDAIKEKILCPFEYIPLEYKFTNEEKKKHSKLINKLRGIKKHQPYEKGMIDHYYREISKCYKLAENKPSKFEDLIIKSGGKESKYLKRCIIYCEEKKYINEHVVPVISKFSDSWKIYVGNEKAAHLERFRNGEIEILIACEKLNEGVNIPSINCIVMFSFSGSDESLVVTQRIGRALRIVKGNPSKIANVIDFIRSPSKPGSSESKRKEWLEKLAAIRP